MITSMCKELGSIDLPKYDGELSMLRFNLSNLNEVPEYFKDVVSSMIDNLPSKDGFAFLTVDGRQVQSGNSQRRGGKHIDGNFLNINSVNGWSNSWGGNGWKVGEGGTSLTSKEHKRSYLNKRGGMLIASTYPASKGWVGEFKGEPKEGGDVSHIDTGEGFILQPNTLYYGNSQFIHESLPIDKTIHRTLFRITLPEDYIY